MDCIHTAWKELQNQIASKSDMSERCREELVSMLKDVEQHCMSLRISDPWIARWLVTGAFICYRQTSKGIDDFCASIDSIFTEDLIAVLVEDLTSTDPQPVTGRPLSRASRRRAPFHTLRKPEESGADDTDTSLVTPRRTEGGGFVKDALEKIRKRREARERARKAASVEEGRAAQSEEPPAPKSRFWSGRRVSGGGRGRSARDELDEMREEYISKKLLEKYGRRRPTGGSVLATTGRH